MKGGREEASFLLIFCCVGFNPAKCFQPTIISPCPRASWEQISGGKCRSPGKSVFGLFVSKLCLLERRRFNATMNPESVTYSDDPGWSLQLWDRFLGRLSSCKRITALLMPYKLLVLEAILEVP